MEIKKMEVAELLILGNTLREQNKIDEAAAVYSQSLYLNPSCFWAHYHLANIWLEQAKVNEAIVSYQRAIEIDPSFHWSYHHLGNAFAQQQRWQEAAVSFQQALSLHSEHYGTYHGLGQSLQKLGNFDEAIVAFQKGIELNQDSDWLKSDLIGAIEQKLDLKNQLLFNTYYSLAQSFVKQGKQEEAISYWLIILQQFSNILEPETLRQVASNIIGEQLVDDDRIKIYGKISKMFFHKGQLEQAITILCSAILLNSNCQELYHILGEIISQKMGLQSELDQLRMDLDETQTQLLQVQAKLTKSEDIKTAFNETQTQLLQLQAELTISKNIAKKSISYYQWAVESHPEELLSKKEWEQATNTLRYAMEIAPESGYNAYVLGLALTRIGQEEEALAVFHRAVELLEQQAKVELTILSYQEMLKLSSNGDIFFKLGMLLAQCGRFAEALTAYEQALQSPSGKPEDYAKLAVILVQQGFGEEVFNCGQKLERTNDLIKLYQELGLLLYQEGLVTEAVRFFQQVPGVKTSGKWKIYQDIWDDLNQKDVLAAGDWNYPTEIELEEVAKYFANISNYRVMTLDSLSESDKDYLEKHGLYLPYLKLFINKTFSLEQILIKSFDDSPEILGKKINLAGYGSCDFSYEQSLIETGYIYSFCPFSGKILRSNQSLVINHRDLDDKQRFDLHGFCYRFVGEEVFYLMTGHVFGYILLIYFPKLDLIININAYHLADFSYKPVENMNKLKSYMVTCWKQVKSYIASPHVKQVVDVIGLQFNMGHYFWQDLVGIHVLCKNGLLHKLDKILVGPGDYLRAKDVFPEIPSEKFVEVEDVLQVFKTVVANNYVALKVNGIFIEEDLATKVYQGGIKQSSNVFLQEVEKAKKHFPLILIWIRSHSRVWLSQVEGFANIINTLAAEFPNLGIIFDGWGSKKTYEEGTAREIERVNETIHKILPLITQDVYIYNSNGSMNHQKVVCSRLIDCYIASHGSALTFPVWIGGKPGVVHGTPYDKEQFSKCEFSGIFRENVVDAIPLLPDVFDSNGWVNEYDMDWRRIYEEVVKIIRGLSS
ncbi:tetratricopeptide repeat protein [Lyngbya sp. CCAP 1446/10]|uniref:tetratricopeptide repeat protein n=1 Tax=Lyngbya sp. CCAP 1446/10 TaxID=439293 RepID=UPI0022387376|nr:tetratricopeptide repeat protein [Lyngbya sp. CCAP 1446/10]MCW6050391.1 tetratricopeptide repeat protein [Lyngbya sp. CCAP 1446/10]